MDKFTTKEAVCVVWGMNQMFKHPEIGEFDYKKYQIPNSEWWENERRIKKIVRLDLAHIKELLGRWYEYGDKLEDSDLVTMLIALYAAVDAEKHRYDYIKIREDLKIPKLFDKNM